MLDRLEVLTTPAPATAPAECARLVEELIIDESKHEAVEEEFFWPAVTDRVPDGKLLAERAIEQETEAKQVLNRLDQMTTENLDFVPLVRSFVTAGRAHIAYEETEVWPLLRAALSPAEAEELGGKLAAAKKTAPTRPHPHTPPNPMLLRTAGPAIAAADRLRDAASGRGSTPDEHSER
jgi:hypothetical protein